MAKITRKNQKMFGSTAGALQLGVFGSLAAGSADYSADPDDIQSLSNYLTGWFGAIVGSNSPAIEDMNALCYLYAYQLSYIFQAGVPEWNADTTYYIGSLVSDGAGAIYISKTDDNVNHVITDATYWRTATAPIFTLVGGNESWVCPASVHKVRVSVLNAMAPQLRINTSSIIAIAQNGSTYGWGLNGNGQLGQGNVTPKSSPVVVLGTQFFNAASCNGGSHVVALDFTGAAYTWGLNANGQLGDGGVVPVSSPTVIAAAGSYRRVAAGGAHSAALTPAGAAYCWGQNTSGQLGDNSIIPQSVPTLVTGSLVFEAIACGATHTVAIRGDTSAAAAWGSNAKGQLGDGTVTGRSAPTAVVGGYTFKAISAGNNFTLGLAEDGKLYAWGSNANGELGDGTIVAKSSPVLVLGGLEFKQAVAGNGYCIALDTRGNVYGWGVNTNGQLGDGASVLAKSSPTLVVGSLVATQVAAGGDFAAAMTTEGDIYAWGNNANGQLGDGTVVAKSSPVLVLGALQWRAVNETLLNEQVVQVTPGLTYAVKNLARTCSFGANTVYADEYGTGVTPTMILIEQFN